MSCNPNQSTQGPECALVARVAKTETPMITELVAAVLHLERVVETAGTPQEETASYTGQGASDDHITYVLNNADRIRQALHKITAPYIADPAAN